MRSEINNIPENWIELELGKVFCFLKTSSYSRNQTSKSSKNALYIHYGDIHKINKFTLDFSKENILRLNDNIDSSSLDFLQNGDLIITDASEDYLGIGRCFEIKNLNEKAVSGLHTFALRSNSNLVSIGFSPLLLNSFSVRNYLKKIATGATVFGIAKSNLLKMPLLLPPLTEQTRIAEILGTWDRAITAIESLIATKETQFNWLKSTLLRHNPNIKNWQKVKLGEVGKFYRGLSGKNKENFGSGKKYLPYMGIFLNSKIDVSVFGRVMIEDNEKQEQVKKGDIFFTISSETPEEVGMSSVLLNDIGECYLNSFCVGYRLNTLNYFSLDYLRFFLRSILFRKQIIQLAQGSTRYNISKNFLSKIYIYYPPLSEQKRIAEILDTARKEIDILTQLLAQYRLQKKGLMQKLLTGEWRAHTTPHTQNPPHTKHTKHTKHTEGYP